MRSLFATVLFIPLYGAPATAANPTPVGLEVDASEVGRRILHVRVVVPSRPGPLTLLYPKWVPGTHGPTTPISDLAGFRITANGADITWTRDDIDPYATHLTVPAGADSVVVTFDLLLPGLSEAPQRQNTVASAKLAILNLCDLLVYPKAPYALQLPFRLVLRLPAGWTSGTALPLEQSDGNLLHFGTVSLETLIDSPILCGQYTKDVPIGPPGSKHRVFLACDSEAGLDVPAETKAAWDKLISEAGHLFGSQPYGSYTFLLALSDKMRFRGLEHHESSDNRLPELALTTPPVRNFAASLLPHEYVHSWCGKYRRPADMIVADFQISPKTRMLWVYEGLTNYLGWVLTARSGLGSAEAARDSLAVTAERMKNARGRAWRSLEDTAAASHLLAESRGSWGSWRRSLDYYDEGTLLWLEADIIIRRETKGAKSLDDFCQAFFACAPGRPKTRGFTFDELVTALAAVAPYDWKGHFTRRVTLPTVEAPLDGITLGGWNLGYTDKPTDTIKASEGISKAIDLTSSVGVRVSGEGAVQDVIPESPAAKAGLGPGMKLVAVNGRKFTPDLLRSTVAATRTGGKLDLLIENGDFFNTHAVDYHDGAKYPRLDRTMAEPDRIGDVLKSRSPGVKK